MKVLTGAIANQLVRIGPGEHWSDLQLVNCTISAGPHAGFAHLANAAFVNCIFLYDGMEVDAFEWAGLMRRGAEFGAPLPPRPH